MNAAQVEELLYCLQTSIYRYGNGERDDSGTNRKTSEQAECTDASDRERCCEEGPKCFRARKSGWPSSWIGVSDGGGSWSCLATLLSTGLWCGWLRGLGLSHGGSGLHHSRKNLILEIGVRHACACRRSWHRCRWRGWGRR